MEFGPVIAIAMVFLIVIGVSVCFSGPISERVEQTDEGGGGSLPFSVAPLILLMGLTFFIYLVLRSWG